MLMTHSSFHVYSVEQSVEEPASSGEARLRHVMYSKRIIEESGCASEL